MLEEPADLTSGCRAFVISHPNIASKRWVTDQYDSMVGASTMTTNRPSDAAVVAVIGTDKAIVITVDCNSRYVYADPQKGTARLPLPKPRVTLPVPAANR